MVKRLLTHWISFVLFPVCSQAANMPPFARARLPAKAQFFLKRSSK